MWDQGRATNQWLRYVEAGTVPPPHEAMHMGGHPGPPERPGVPVWPMHPTGAATQWQPARRHIAWCAQIPLQPASTVPTEPPSAALPLPPRLPPFTSLILAAWPPPIPALAFRAPGALACAARQARYPRGCRRASPCGHALVASDMHGQRAGFWHAQRSRWRLGAEESHIGWLICY